MQDKNVYGKEISYTFMDDVEKKLKYVKYCDTDSLFIHFGNYKVKDLQETKNFANKEAEIINEKNIERVTKYILPKLGIDPKYNETFFKTEIIANSIYFSGNKKSYAYRLLAKENKDILSKPIKYTGLIAKSDIPQYTKDIIKSLIEDIMFDLELTDQQKKIKADQLIQKFKNQISEHVNNLDLKLIGSPKKWSTKTKNNQDVWQITAMRLWNTITQTETFKPMVGGILLPIIIDNVNNFLQKIQPLRHLKNTFLLDTLLNNITYLAFPYNLDVEKTKQLMKEFSIKINEVKIWEKLYNVMIQNIMILFNDYSNPILNYRLNSIN